MNGLLAGLGLLGAALMASRSRFYMNIDSANVRDKQSAIAILNQTLQLMKSKPKVSGANVYRTRDGNYEVTVYEF